MNSPAVRFLNPAEAARRLGVSAKALRLYEQRGLLTPARTEAGWRSYGPDEMARGAEIAALTSRSPEDYAHWRAGTFAPENGEIWAGFRARVAAAIADALDGDAQTVLMVCHGGVIRAALDGSLGLSPARIIPVGPASLTILAFPSGLARLEVFNATPMAPVVDAPD